ncbi:MAG TPA: hypothetical protein VJ044_15285, partial [Candidatus Hodarchaeales archaeon]|nr:hypothetical protein [Candidatus Hodarchaeales archaeon]
VKKAGTTEADEGIQDPVIYLLPTQNGIQEIGGSMRLGIHELAMKKYPGSKVWDLYNGEGPKERFRHRYEFNRKYQELLERQGVRFVGTSPDGEIFQIFELDTAIHPYFVGTQFHPEFLSRPTRPHPLFLGLVKEAKTYHRQQLMNDN